MAGWDYIVGEGGYDQPFVFIDKGTNEGFDATGVTSVLMTILDSDLSATVPPISDEATTVDTADPLRTKLAVTTAKVPQAEGSYIAQFKITIGGEIRKTYELGLRVYNG